MQTVISPCPPVLLPVRGSDAMFPVNNLYCVGRNYAAHAVEMGGDPNREPPFFFMKPTFSVLGDGGELRYPEHSADVHHEVELVVAISSGGRAIAVEAALDHVYGYAVGIDMTRRDLQGEAKAAGLPWTAGKVFLHSAPCSAICPATDAASAENRAIGLAINGETRQQGNTGQMIWKIPEVIARLSTLFHLQPGDLIYTGTPAGVGPVSPGDGLHAWVDGIGDLRVGVV